MMMKLLLGCFSPELQTPRGKNQSFDRRSMSSELTGEVRRFNMLLPTVSFREPQWAKEGSCRCLTILVAVTTYEQALTWLSATEDMDDSFLLSMFGVKVSPTEPRQFVGCRSGAHLKLHKFLSPLSQHR